MSENIIGKKFSRLTVQERVEDHISPSGRHEKMYLCKCDCGASTVVREASLKNGNTKSCGCLRRELSSSRRRNAIKDSTPEYKRIRKIWNSMRRRCENESCNDYRNYGGRGISVCDEWLDFYNFLDWSLKHGYRDDLTIDRISSSGDYCPQNCRWADKKTQNNNTSRNHIITYNGRTQSLALWADELGFPYSTLKSRIVKHKWSLERAMTTPLKK